MQSPPDGRNPGTLMSDSFQATLLFLLNDGRPLQQGDHRLQRKIQPQMNSLERPVFSWMRHRMLVGVPWEAAPLRALLSPEA